MDEQLFTVLMTVFSGLCLVIGFFISFILYQILGSQSSLEEKFITVLTRLECLTADTKNQQRIIDMVIEQLGEKCDRADCILNHRRNGDGNFPL